MTSRTGTSVIFSESSIIGVSEGQVSAELADEVVILDLKAGVYYGLNPVGARIWDFIQEPKTVGQIKNMLLAKYEVEPERCEQELQQLFQDLAAKGLIDIKNEP